MPTAALDMILFRLLNGLAGTSRIFDFAAVFAARWLIFVLAVVIAWSAALSVRRLAAGNVGSGSSAGLAIAVRSGVASLLSSATSLFFALILFRHRPFVSLDGVRLLVDPPPFAKSFPSDHTTLAFALAVSVFMVSRRWGCLALLTALAVGLGRISVGVHYPSDVLAGAALGTAWAAVVSMVGERLHDRRRLERLLQRWNGFGGM